MHARTTHDTCIYRRRHPILDGVGGSGLTFSFIHPPHNPPAARRPKKQILVMQGVDSKAIFRIKGKFPTKGVRYFSLQVKKAHQQQSTINDCAFMPACCPRSEIGGFDRRRSFSN
jgi:hypothetical protein